MSRSRSRHPFALGPAAICIGAALAVAPALPAAATGTGHFKDDNGVPYSVTPLQLFRAQPANEFDAAPQGSVLDAVEFRVRNTSLRHSMSDDANNDATLIAGGQIVTASFDQISGCSNFDNGEIDLAPAQGIKGCVVFEVRKGISVTKVRWVADSGLGAGAQWPVKS